MKKLIVLLMMMLLVISIPFSAEATDEIYVISEDTLFSDAVYNNDIFIFTNHSNLIEFDEVEFSGCSFYGQGTIDYPIEFCIEGSSVTFTGCYFENISFYLAPSASGSLTNSEIVGGNIIIESTDSFELSDLVIRDNLRRDYYYPAIEVDSISTTQCVLSRMTIQNCFGGIKASSSMIDISECHILSCNMPIELISCWDSSINDNILEDSLVGVKLSDAYVECYSNQFFEIATVYQLDSWTEMSSISDNVTEVYGYGLENRPVVKLTDGRAYFKEFQVDTPMKETILSATLSEVVFEGCQLKAKSGGTGLVLEDTDVVLGDTDFSAFNFEMDDESLVEKGYSLQVKAFYDPFIGDTRFFSPLINQPVLCQNVLNDDYSTNSVTGVTGATFIGNLQSSSFVSSTPFNLVPMYSVNTYELDQTRNYDTYSISSSYGETTITKEVKLTKPTELIFDFGDYVMDVDPGWNLVSFPIQYQAESRDFIEVLNFYDMEIASITWRDYLGIYHTVTYSDGQAYGDLDFNITEKEGYFVYYSGDEARSLPFGGEVVTDRSVDIYSGWNLVPILIDTTLDDLVYNLPEEPSAITIRTDEGWVTYTPPYLEDVLIPRGTAVYISSESAGRYLG